MAEVHWRALIAPVNVKDAGGRSIPMGSTARYRRLPLPFRYQREDWGGHSGAVQVGNIDRVWMENGALWGEGTFDLDDPLAQDVVRKIRSGFVRHVSADIEPGSSKLMGATIVDIPAFEDAEIKEILVPELDVVVPDDARELMSFAFRVVGDLKLPFAERDRPWDEQAASDRVEAWASDGDGSFDPGMYRRAFLYVDEGADPELKGSYKLGFADVIDGELTAVPRAIFAVAGGRGVDAADIPGSDKTTIKTRVSELYKRMGVEFDDPSLRAPWDREDDASDDGGEFASDDLVERFAVAKRAAAVAVTVSKLGGI